jgi:hypothetical protein
MWVRCSSQVWLKIRMSSKYTTTNELVNGHNMLSINLMKVVRLFVNLKGMTIHSKRTSLALKVVFHTSDHSNWYLVIPELQFDLAEIFFPFELVQNVINPWDRVFILDSDLVQCSIVNTESPSPILLLHQHDQAPTGR